MDEWNDQQQMVVLRAEARRRYQILINYIKDQVEPGYAYENELVRVVVSERGCYYEFVDLPEEFSGALGSGFTQQFVGSGQGLDLVERLYHISEMCDEYNTRDFSLLEVYSRQGLFSRDDTYIYHVAHQADEDVGPISVGVHRPGVLPLFLKVKADSDLMIPVFGAPRGVLFLAANLSDQHLVVNIPQVGPGVCDLAGAPVSATVN